MTQIITQLNPDVPPTGSDLGIINAARKSFGRRSEWDYVHPDGTVWNKIDEVQSYYAIDDDGVKTWVTRQLKDKDKRLLEFLARGMTAADFDEFLVSAASKAYELVEYADPREEYQPLIDMLWEWRNTPTHDTPFNHSFFSFEVKAPVFVARHLVKHEYLIMSEYSRRYITDDIEFYTPKVWRKAAADVKQGSSSEEVNVAYYDRDDGYNDWPTDANSIALEAYQEMLKLGVAPEQARMVLPQSLMTSWTWSGTLGAFSNMCKLRLSSDTQAETREVAEAVYEELKKQFPVAAPLLVEGVL
jgi:thymidylate synthase (FAD)